MIIPFPFQIASLAIENPLLHSGRQWSLGVFNMYEPEPYCATCMSTFRNLIERASHENIAGVEFRQSHHDDISGLTRSTSTGCTVCVTLLSSVKDEQYEIDPTARPLTHYSGRFTSPNHLELMFTDTVWEDYSLYFECFKLKSYSRKNPRICSPQQLSHRLMSKTMRPGNWM